MTAPLVSVIIPCHNAEKTLAETLASVLQQSQISFEVIAINDDSTDATAEILLSFGSQLRRIDVQLRGAGAARNVGLTLAQGRYIQFLDADDLLMPGTLARRFHALESSNADVAYCDWCHLDEQADGSFKVGRSTSRTIEDVHPRPEIAMLTDFWAPLAALLYRRTLVEQLGGFREDLRVIEDARLLQDAALADAHFVRLPGIGAHYRVPLHNNTRSRRDPALFVLDCLENAQQIEALWRARALLDSQQQQALGKVYNYCTSELLRHARRPAFFKALTALYAVEPRFSASRPKIAGLLWRVLPHAMVTAGITGLSHLGRLVSRRP